MKNAIPSSSQGPKRQRYSWGNILSESIEAAKDDHDHPSYYFPSNLLEQNASRTYAFIADGPQLPYFESMEKLVGLIGSTDGLPYDVQGRLQSDISKDLRAALPLIHNTLSVMVKHRHVWIDAYSPRMTLLVDSFDRHFDDLDPFGRPEAFVVRDPLAGVVTGGQTAVRMGVVINAFIADVRSVWRSREFAQRESRWRGRFNLRMKRAESYVAALYAAYPKLVGVRVDFYQEKFDPEELMLRCATGWQASTAELELLSERVNRLLNNRRHFPKVFEFCVGYIIKLEYAPVRGWHAHTLFFFDGQEVRNDSYYSIEVGNYWVDVITKGQGTYNAVNRAKNKAQLFYNGIGTIHETDDDKREVLMREVIGYMAKSDLYLQSKSFKGQKLFRMGKTPEPPAQGPGRPRKSAAGRGAGEQDRRL